MNKTPINLFLKQIMSDYASMTVKRFNDNCAAFGKDGVKVYEYYHKAGCLKKICYDEHVAFIKFID